MAKLQYAERKAQAAAARTSGNKRISASDRKWIEEHGGTVGVVSESEARERESAHQERTKAAVAKQVGRRTTTDAGYDPADIVIEQQWAKARKAAAVHVDPSDVMETRAKPSLKVYRLQTQRGSKTFEAVDEDQARRMADRAGLEVSGITETGTWELTPKRKAELLRQAGYKHGREKLELLIKAGQLPRDTKLVKDTSGKWQAVRERDVEQLKELEKYKTATGQYNLAAAMEAGVTERTLIRVGFASADVKAIRDFITKQKALVQKLKPFWMEGKVEGPVKYSGGYDLSAAMAAGITEEELLKAGFPPASVSAAQWQSIYDPSPLGTYTSSPRELLERKYPKFTQHLNTAGLGYSLAHLQKLEISRKTVGDKEAWKAVRNAIAEAKAKGMKVPTERELFTAWGEELKHVPSRLEPALASAVSYLATWAEGDSPTPSPDWVEKWRAGKLAEVRTKAEVGKWAEETGKERAAAQKYAQEKWLDPLWKWARAEESPILRAGKSVLGGIPEVLLGVSLGIVGGAAEGSLQMGADEPRRGLNTLSAIPLGVATWAAVETPKHFRLDPWGASGQLCGNLLAFPVLKGAFKVLKTGTAGVMTVAKGGTLPRGLKSGGMDLVRVRVPEGFEQLRTGLETIAKDQAAVKAIFESGLKPKAQMEAIRMRLNPQTRAIYDAVIAAAEAAKGVNTPKGLLRPVDLAEVLRIPDKAAPALKAWLQSNSGEVKVGGSFADWLQTKGVKAAMKAKDLDIRISKGGKLTKEGAVAQLAELIRKEAGVKTQVKGNKVQVWKDGKWENAIDVHWVGEFGEMPYGWVRESITLEGIKFDTLASQILARAKEVVRPKAGKERGLVGPEEFRLKDMGRFETGATTLADALRKQGKTGPANQLDAGVKMLMEGPRGKAIPLSRDRTAAFQREFVELVAEIQEGALTRGVEIVLEHRLGTLARIVTPAGKVVPGTVYTAVRDIGPYIEALKKGKAIEAGKVLDASGRWVKAARREIYTSPDAAWDFLYDATSGKVPKTAGIVAIRAVKGNIGKGKALEPVSRAEYISEKGVEVAVVLDELVLQTGRKAYATNPTGLSLRKGSTSRGLTGESVTYHPATQGAIPILWLATKEAKAAGLGAPSLAQATTINLLALWETIRDLAHPHLPKHVKVSGRPASRGVGLVEFYRPTWKWTGRGKAGVAKLTEKADTALRGKALEAMRKREAKGETFNTLDQWTQGFIVELQKAGVREAAGMLSIPGVAKALRATSPEKFTRTYVINLQNLTSNIATAGIGASSLTDLTKVTDADLITLTPEVKGYSPSTYLSMPALQSALGTVGTSTRAEPTTKALPTSVMALRSGITPTTPGITTTTPTTPTSPRLTTRPTTPATRPTPRITTTPVAKTLLRLGVKPTTKPRPRITTVAADVRFNQLTEAQRRGIIAWKQGWCYKIMAPSAKGVVMINSRKPLVGVKYHEGPGSPQRSAIAHGGGIPAKIKYDMGVVDVNISVPQEFYRFERKPKLAFEPDLEQQTWETRPGWGRPVASRPQGILRTRPDRQRRTARTSKPRKAKKSKTTRQALMLKHKKTTPGISQVGGL